jgi:arylsulfatase
MKNILLNDRPPLCNRIGSAGSRRLKPAAQGWFRFVHGALVLLTLVLVPPLGVCAGCSREKEGDAERPKLRPDIVFVMVDTLRADRLGAHGPRRSNSPTIDAIASEGVRFERVISGSPWTQPSIASLFSSVYPGVHKVLNFQQAITGRSDREQRVAVFDESLATLPEQLQQLGYETAAFVANLFILEEYGFGRGFDHFEDFDETRPDGEVINREVIRWLEQRPHRDKPLFLYLHYMDVHGPYDAGPAFHEPLLDEVEGMLRKRRLTGDEIERLGYLGRPPKDHRDTKRHERLAAFREYWVARYDAGIREFDDHLKVLRAALMQAGIWQDAYVVVTSDHGEALCEHGHWDHGYSVHNTEVHVPLILRWPEHLPTGRRVEYVVSLIDVMPTLLDQLGGTLPDRIQGSSLVQLIAGHKPAEPSLVFSEAVKAGDEQKAVQYGKWKLIAIPETGRRMLFDLSKDPEEQDDVSGRYPDGVGALEELLDQQLAENEMLSRDVTPSTRKLRDDQIERLRSLGYLGG